MQSETNVIDDYISILASFHDGKIKINEFVIDYMDLVKSDEYMKPDWVYDILQRVFSACDLYWPDGAPAGEIHVTEEELKIDVENAHSGLLKYKSEREANGGEAPERP